MYTQCPQCRVAFRITVDVLQQARGQVRCGSCGEAFNALDYLTETPPPRASNPPAGRRPGDQARSRALMDTLNQLVGPDDVRIEDTGVEWRVIDREDVGEIDAGHLQPPDDTADDGSAGDATTPDLHDETAAQAAETIPVNDEPRYDDNTPLGDDFRDDDPGQPAWEPPQRRATSFKFDNDEQHIEAQTELDLSEPDEWDDLLDEFRDGAGENPDRVDVPGTDGEAAVESATRDDHDDDEALPKLDETSDGIELTGDDLSYDNGLTLSDDETIENAIDGDATGEIDLTAEYDNDLPDGDTAIESRTPHEDAGSDEYAWDYELDDTDAEAVSSQMTLLAGDDETGSADDNTDFEAFDEEDVEEYEFDGASAGDGTPAHEGNRIDTPDDDRDGSTMALTDPDIGASDADPGEAPEETEEDRNFAAMTANMKIDPDVLRAMREGDLEARDEDGSPLVETIIMEGDFIRDSLDEAAEIRRSTGHKDPESLLDTYIGSRAPEKKSVTSRLFMGVGIVVLLLGLAAQVVHSQRETLATYDLFNRTIGPIYRSVGMPVIPNWDVKGWQFEGTRGNTTGEQERLTITSRISNRSAQSLPYPLIHVSLTDRYEEVIGSRMLEPDDYLGDGSDPTELVPAGENFTATITIAAAAPEATGFKLNVCYRESGSRVRCAIEDFKEP